jgi:hypothetical protein
MKSAYARHLRPLHKRSRLVSTAPKSTSFQLTECEPVQFCVKIRFSWTISKMGKLNYRKAILVQLNQRMTLSLVPLICVTGDRADLGVQLSPLSKRTAFSIAGSGIVNHCQQSTFDQRLTLNIVYLLVHLSLIDQAELGFRPGSLPRGVV